MGDYKAIHYVQEDGAGGNVVAAQAYSFTVGYGCTESTLFRRFFTLNTSNAEGNLLQSDYASSVDPTGVSPFATLSIWQTGLDYYMLDGDNLVTDKFPVMDVDGPCGAGVVTEVSNTPNLAFNQSPPYIEVDLAN